MSQKFVSTDLLTNTTQIHTWLCRKYPIRLSWADAVVQQTLIHSLILWGHVCYNKQGARDLKALGWSDGISVEQPGDVGGGVSSCDASKTCRGARRDKLVGQAFRDRHRLCGAKGWNTDLTTRSAANSPRIKKNNLLSPCLTENIHSIVSADHSPLHSLSCTGVTPFIVSRHLIKGQVVVLYLMSSGCDLLSVFKPFCRWYGTTGDDTLQRQRLRLLHRNSHWGGGVNYPHGRGGV